MSKIVITGSQSGMGLAFRNDLEALGEEIIGVDLPGKNAEVEADLSTNAGCSEAVMKILELSDGKIKGVIANAGVDNNNARLVFGLNYFGVVNILEGLHGALAANKNARVVITASNSIVITPGIPLDVVQALNNNDLEKAIELVNLNPQTIYPSSKLAIARWMRTHAASKKWAGSGITMNAIAPGAVLTPLLEHDLADPAKAPFINALPRPLGEWPRPEDIAGIVRFLISENAKYIIGQVIIADGGMENTWRNSDSPRPWNITPDDFMKKLTLQIQ
jgi:NAD(P)-dependent dehydrogenase (short-subunit alcohol dehydrogenase family)